MKGRRVKKVRVLVIGDAHSGKTTLTRLMFPPEDPRKFEAPARVTFGTQKSSSKENIGNVEYEFQILEIPGGVWFKLRMFYSKCAIADLVVVVMDAENLIKEGIEGYRRKFALLFGRLGLSKRTETFPPFILVANKSDRLSMKQREEVNEMVMKLANEFNLIPTRCVSALFGLQRIAKEALASKVFLSDIEKEFKERLEELDRNLARMSEEEKRELVEAIEGLISCVHHYNLRAVTKNLMGMEAVKMEEVRRIIEEKAHEHGKMMRETVMRRLRYR